jgi:Papain family cysteine protease
MVSDLAGMGRLRQWDQKNCNYLMPKKAVPETVRRRFWNAGDVLDQGDTPQCVGYAGYGWLQAGPITNRHLSFTPTDLYHWAQDNDEWPGSDYDGSSTLGLMKALKDKGYVKDYVWALDAETLVAWILTTGPVVVGTNWYRDMFTPDKDHFLEPVGSIDGGHEWRIIGADRDQHCYDGSVGAVRMVNSWGRNWGDHGRAWVSFNDLDKLIKDQGEAVTATEIRL